MGETSLHAVSSSLEQAVLYRVMQNKLVKLEIIIYRRLLLASTFVVIKSFKSTTED